MMRTKYIKSNRENKIIPTKTLRRTRDKNGNRSDFLEITRIQISKNKKCFQGAQEPSKKYIDHFM